MPGEPRWGRRGRLEHLLSGFQTWGPRFATTRSWRAHPAQHNRTGSQTEGCTAGGGQRGDAGVAPVCPRAGSRGLSPRRQTHPAHSINRLHGRGGTHGTPPAPGAYVTRNSYSSSPLFLPVMTQRALPCLSRFSDMPLPFLQPPNIRKASPRRKPTMVRSREVRTTGAPRRRCPSSADSPGCALLCS